MKKSILFCIMILFPGFTAIVKATHVKPKEAKKVAKNFFWQVSDVNDYTEIKPVLLFTARAGDKDLYYVFKFENEKGFVIIPADDFAAPVIGFSTKNDFDIDNMPPHIISWLQHYKDQIKCLQLHEDNNHAYKRNSKWDEYTVPVRDKPVHTRSVDVLLSTTWNQGRYYNTYCPEDNNGPDGHVWTGCVATAMAQIMKYHSYPEHGTGMHSYSHPVYGEQFADFENTIYAWDNMPDYLTDYNEEVARLLYHFGVAVDMDYSPQESKAYSTDARNAIVTYFGYSDDAKYLSRSNYTVEDWKNILRNQLNARLPVYYRGANPGTKAAHAFVCDGYDDNGYFHMNFGWGGSCDGFYLLDDLTPCGHDYNDDQGAIINIYDVSPFPGCTSLIYPKNGSVNVSISAGLTWEAVPDAEGYLLSIGTTSGGTEILDKKDIGNVTTYDPGDFPFYTTIYVTIRPYNQNSYADNCKEMWFQTEFDHSKAFITTWKTTSDNEDIIIPIEYGYSYNYDVDWGDGTVTAHNTWHTAHTYEKSGTYQVAIIGKFPSIYFNNAFHKNKIISIDQWGDIQWRTMKNAFWGCSNLTVKATDIPDLSMVTDMSNMFKNVTAFTQNFNDWDVSGVTNMKGLFEGAESFNQDIGDWNVSNVTDMTNMFKNANAFNQDISNWNVSGVILLKGMFEGAKSFNQDIGNWDVSNVTDMSGMFKDAVSFNRDIGDWNVTNVTDMSSMFERAKSFNQDIGDWDVSNVIDMNSMFAYAGSFNQDISGWDVSKVKNMILMFYLATSFNRDIGNWDVSNVNTMVLMFSGAKSFDQNLGNWDVSNVSGMSGFLQGITLSTANYDSLLIGWSNLTLKKNINFSGGNSNYCKGANARQSIIDTFGWTIWDGGRDSTCAPPCTNLIIPNDGATNIKITTDLKWLPVKKVKGYILTVGTTSGGTDILDNVDVGNVTSYDPGDFPCGSDIFVTIIPYNALKKATGCLEESFSTEDVKANASEDTEICEGGSVLLYASGGTSYNWTPYTGLDNPFIPYPLATPDSTITYTVTVSNNGRCSDIDSVTVIVNPNPIVNVNVTDETGYNFNDGTATANPNSGTPPYSYRWNTGDTTSTITGLSPAIYQLTVTDAKGCSTVDTVKVKAFVCPSLTIKIQSINASCYGACDGSATVVNVDNAFLPLSFAWNTGDTTVSASNLCAGDYIVSVTDTKNCTVSDTITLTQPDEIIIAVDSTGDILKDVPGFIKITTNNKGNYVFAWTGPNGFMAKTGDLDSLLTGGCYTLTVFDTSNGCSNDTTICIIDKISTYNPAISYINIYPNPADGEFIIDFSGLIREKAEIIIYNPSGMKHLILTKNENDGIVKIHSGNFNTGLYIVLIKFAKYGTVYKKIVISR